jgi:ParB family chromosome partitioning protein
VGGPRPGGHRHSPRAVAALIAALEDPDPDVRACAVVGLAQLRPPEAVEPLVARLSDPSAYVARLAADALAQIGAPRRPGPDRRTGG